MHARNVGLNVQEASSDRDNLQKLVPSDPMEWQLRVQSATIQHDARHAVVQALGSGAEIPRILRATGQVLQQLCLAVALPESCQSYVFATWLQVCVDILDGQQLSRTLWELLRSMPRQCKTLHGALFDVWLSQDCLARTVVPRGYCLMLSLQAHRDADPVATVLHDALDGTLHIHVVQRMSSIVRGVEELFSQMLSLQMPDAATPGYFACEDVSMLLQRMFPSLSDAIWPMLEQQLGGCTARQSVHVQDLAVRGKDCTATQWRVNPQQRPTAEASVDSGPLDAPDGPHLLRESVGGQTHSVASPSGPCEKECEHEGSCVPLDHGTDSVVQTGGNNTDSGYGEIWTAADPSSQVACQPDPQQQDGLALGMAANVVVQILSQHAAALLHLRETLAAELGGLEGTGETASGMHQAIEELLKQYMPQREAHSCASVWVAVFLETGSAASATSDMLAEGPLQCLDDFDLAAASTWLHGLHERSAGHSSSAALPQVA
eukprot:jgi/Ulvmu1/4599/UM002_0328.1